MALTYTGPAGVCRVNGRLMKPGDKITDPEEVKHMTGVEHFEEDKQDPPKPARAKAPKVEE